MNNSFEIYGGIPLNGEVTPQGAKNEALQIIASTLLTKEKVTIHNIPDILDVRTLIELVQDLGVIVERLSSNSYSFLADNINLEYLISPEYKKKIRKVKRSSNVGWAIFSSFQKSLYSSTWWR